MIYSYDDGDDDGDDSMIPDNEITDIMISNINIFLISNPYRSYHIITDYWFDS